MSLKHTLPQVRAMWRSLEGFYNKSSHQRDVVSSVLHGHVDEHAIDGKDIVFQVWTIPPPVYVRIFKSLGVGVQ